MWARSLARIGWGLVQAALARWRTGGRRAPILNGMDTSRLDRRRQADSPQDGHALLTDESTPWLIEGAAELWMNVDHACTRAQGCPTTTSPHAKRSTKLT